MEAQRRRRTEKSQLVVTEFRPPDTHSAFSSQSPGSHGLCLSRLQPAPLWWVQGTDIKACLQYPTPPHPIPTWPGARHAEPAHPQCREHRGAVATPAEGQARRLEAAAVLLLRTEVRRVLGAPTCRFGLVLVDGQARAWKEVKAPGGGRAARHVGINAVRTACGNDFSNAYNLKHADERLASPCLI